jgi:hypothetical protein
MLSDSVSTVGWQVLQLAMPHALSLFLGSIFVAFLTYVIYQQAVSPLAKIPGPFWASLTPLWKLHAFSKGDFHERIVALHEKYGKLVRIAPTEVIISDGSAIRDIYSTTHGKDYLKVFNPLLRF